MLFFFFFFFGFFFWYFSFNKLLFLAKVVFTGSKTEVALINMIKKLDGGSGFSGQDYLSLRANYPILKAVPFSSEKKRMSTVVKNPFGTGNILFCKGASEIILSLSESFIDETGQVHRIDQTTRSEIDAKIVEYANQALRTIGLAYKLLPDTGASVEEAEISDKDLIFIGIVGIQDPVRPEVPSAVAQCQKAGIRIRMVTGDNIMTARQIAKDCGILSKGGIIMEGPEFRRLTPEQVHLFFHFSLKRT